MKSAFSLFLFLTISSNASAGKILIHYEGHNEYKAEELRRRLIGHHYIPERLIKITPGKCNRTDKRFLEFCINSKGDPEMIPNDNKAKILTSFQIFKLKRS